MGARLLALAAALAATSCLKIAPPDGALACATTGRACPSGYACVAGACYKNGSGPTASASASQLSIDPMSLAADGAATATLTLVARTALGRPVPQHDVTVTVSGDGAIVTPPAGQTGDDGSFSATIASTVAEAKDVAVTIDGQTLMTSVTFTGMTPSAAAALSFTQQPSNVAPGTAIVPPVQVQVVDANGNVVPGQRTVMLALGANPGGATLGGTLTQMTSNNGLATFGDLTLDQAGTGYTLVASSGTLPTRTSVAFDVVAGLPSPPTNVMAAGGINQVTLTWTASPGTIDHYDVKRATAATGPFTTVAMPAASPYVDMSLSPGTYFYELDAVHGAQTSAPSNVVSAVVGREICVANKSGNSVVAHSAGEDGNIAFARQLVGADTLLNSPTAIAADLANDELYVANRTSAGTLTVYARATANGDMTPVRTITGLGLPAGVAVDPTNNEVYVTSLTELAVIVFPRTWTGTTPARKRTLGSASAANTTLGSPVAVTLDLANGEMFVADAAQPYAIDVFATSAMGDVAPKRQLTGAATQLNVPSAIAIDDTNDEMFVANFNNSSITVYGRTASGATAPKRGALTGALTGLSGPSGLALDAGNGAILVSNYNAGGQGSVLTFLLGDVGNTKPQRSILGGNTGLVGSYGVAICH